MPTATPTTHNPTIAVVVGVALIAALFLAWKGYEYQACQSRCDRNCAAEADAMNPFKALGVTQNSLGLAFCQQQVTSCRSQCRFP